MTKAEQMVKAGQEWKSKRNGRTVKVIEVLPPLTEDGDTFGTAVIADAGKRRMVAIGKAGLKGYEIVV